MIKMQKIPTTLLGFLVIFSVLLTGFIPLYLIHWITEIPFILVVVYGIGTGIFLSACYHVGDNMKDNMKGWK